VDCDLAMWKGRKDWQLEANISIHKGDRRKYTILTMEFHYSGPLEKCIPNAVRKTCLAIKAAKLLKQN